MIFAPMKVMVVFYVSFPKAVNRKHNGKPDSFSHLKFYRFFSLDESLVDVDGDGNITSADALLDLRHSEGLSSNENIGKPIAA